jgi:hypothetical protein
MCGFGYSTAYAATGEEQIVHYMENRNTRLGYLIVLDARLDANGKPLFSNIAAPSSRTRLARRWPGQGRARPRWPPSQPRSRRQHRPR